MHLFLRSDLVKGAVGIPCPHGGGVECLMHGGTGQASHTPRTNVHDDPFGGHRAIVSHDIRVEPANSDNYAQSSKILPLRKPLSPRRSVNLAHRVVEASKPYHEKPEEFDKLPEHHRQALTDGLRAAGEVLRRARYQRGLSTKAYRRIDDQVARARYMHRDLNSRKEFANLVEERKKYKVPAGHLKKGAKDKATEVSAEVDGNDIPRNMDAAHESLFHRIFGEHTFDDLHNAYSLDHPHYKANLESLNLAHNYGRSTANLTGIVRHSSGEVATDPTFTREFTRHRDGKLHVYHGTFFVKTHHQNHGIAGKVFKNSFRFYQKAGVHHVEVQPVEVGKYTWARMGFHWGDAGTDKAREQLPMYLRDHHGLSREERHRITGEIAHKPWEVAKLEMPLPEKNESGKYGNFKYMGREENPRKPGQYRYKYWNTALGVEDRNGDPLTIEGSNAPADHPHHDPAKGAPRVNAGQDFLLSKHGARVWAAGNHGHILMDPKDPGYQTACDYFGLKPEDATADPQEIADYHRPPPHRMPEHEADEGYSSSSSSSSSRRGTCSNCGEQTASRYDSYCPSCQDQKDEHEAKMEAKRERKEKERYKRGQQKLAERDTLEPGGEVQPHHVLDAMPVNRSRSEYGSESRSGRGYEQAWKRRREDEEGQQTAGPLSEPGVKIHISDDPHYEGKWVLGKDRHWRPIRVGHGTPHLPWTVLHALAQRGRVRHHGEKGPIPRHPSQVSFAQRALRLKGTHGKPAILAMQRWTRSRSRGGK